MKTILMTSLLFCLLSACRQPSPINNSTVSHIDLNRFLGHWYEIARFYHSFERGLNYTEAEYTLRSDGKIDVVNKGVRNNKRRTSKGKAKLTSTPGLLRVSFFGPFYSDYRILSIDRDYQHALIGSSSSKYLWILSRTPQINDSVKSTLLNEASRRGYDTSRLIWIKQ